MAAEHTSRELYTLRRMHHLMSSVNGGLDLEEMLQTVVEGVCDIVGFRVAVISQIRSDETLEVVAVAGDDEARETLLGQRTPIDRIFEEFAVADYWGSLRFVPHERAPGEVPLGWVPDFEPTDDPDAWHPLDALFAPLYDPTGALSGMLSVDLPYDGRRPGQMQRDVLEMYAAQAAIVLNNAQQRIKLEEAVRLADATHAIMQTVGSDLDLKTIIDGSVRPVLRGFRADGVWIRAFANESVPGSGFAAIYPDELPLSSTPDLERIARRVAEDCWRGQRSVTLTAAHQTRRELTSAEELTLLRGYLADLGVDSLLFVPLGAGRDCLGYMALTRVGEDRDWTEEEEHASLEIGRDLGRVLMHARLFERERQLVDQLVDLDRYKTDLIATISHELKNPLTSIRGHLELIGAGVPGLDTGRSLGSIDRSTRRLTTLVDDLLLLSKVGDPHRPLSPVEVDLGGLAAECNDLLRVQAEQRDVKVLVTLPEEPVRAWGNRADLDCVVTNVLGNAIKYTRAGGHVDVAVRAEDGHAVFECRDHGIGISEADRAQLFTEFFRSSNPEARACPGTGLGLTIVKRIVDRHGGSVTVDSELDAGSTFTVRIPLSRQ